MTTTIERTNTRRQLALEAVILHAPCSTETVAMWAGGTTNAAARMLYRLRADGFVHLRAIDGLWMLPSRKATP